MRRSLLGATLSVCLLLHPALAEPLQVAGQNAVQAQEALVRSHRVLQAYLKRRDTVTGLLPRRAGQNTWYVRDSAADLFPFLVMAAYYTDRSAYEHELQEMFRNELRHSTRIGSLSDNVLAGGGFENAEPKLADIIFGSAEYVKDGLLPLTELLGRQGWYARMESLCDDLIANASYDTPFGKIPSNSAEINGEFLQALARMAFATRQPSYIDQGLAITRFYFQEVIPNANGLPAHLWDFELRKPSSDVFVLADHGNEIAAGLSEFVLFLKETGNPAFAECKEAMAKLIHVLLDCGVNPDGVWYSSISLRDHKPVDARHAHCWGYLFNAVYTTYLITGDQRFLDATKHAMKAVAEKPTYLDDPEGSGRNYKSNAYSDAIESAIVFLNRLPDEQLYQVLDGCVARFLARQREDGIIEDWYGDGNYVRTALMYALMKSAGSWVEPWRPDMRLGAVQTDDGFLATLEVDKEWSGRLRFDISRHKAYFNLPVNYTRLNEWPEWFTVELDRLYRVTIDGTRETRSGSELAQGLDLCVIPGKTQQVRIAVPTGPPYGTRKTLD